MHKYTNPEIAQILAEIANLLDIQGEDQFRIRAYRKAALVIANLPQSLDEIFNKEGEEGLEKLPGIGKKIAQKIIELLVTGQLAQYEHLQHDIPPQLSVLADIRGLGAARLRILHKKLNVNNLDDLKKAALSGKIREIEGFGEKSEENIIKEIANFEKHQERYKMASIYPYAQNLVEFLKQIPGIEQVAIAGSLRRRRETIGDLDIIVAGKPALSLIDQLSREGRIKEVLASGETKITVVLDIGIQSDIRTVAPECFGAGMYYITGSKQHNIVMRQRAQERGLKLNEYGLFKGDERIAGKTEEEIFRALDLPYIPPELREDQGEIQAAEKNKLPRLIERADLLGDLHAHTNLTDGYHSIEQMVHAAQHIGYQYLAITDHSKSQTQARGLTEDKVLEEHKLIDQINPRLKKFKLLKGIEVDILKDGELDFPPEFLKRMDCVVASIHSHFSQTKEEATARVIRAIESGAVNIIGHLTGRLIQEREPVELDVEAVLKAAGAHNVAMELNAHGNRLDLKDIHCRMAKDMGVKIAISTDAHSSMHLQFMQYGIFTARRGWLEPEDVINTWPYEKLMEFLRKKH